MKERERDYKERAEEYCGARVDDGTESRIYL